MSEKLKEVLGYVGFEADEIAALIEGKEDLDVEPLKAKAKTHYVGVLSNDPEFINPIRSQNSAKTLAEVEAKIRTTFGLDESVKGKKIDEVLKAAHAKASTNPAAEQLQADLIAARERIEKYETEIVPAEQKRANEQIRDYARRAAVGRMVAAHQVVINPDDATALLLTKLTAKYNVDIDDAGNVTIFTKENLKPVANNKTLTAAEVIALELEASALIKKNNGGDPAPTPPKPGSKYEPTPGKKSLVNPAAYANLAAMEKIRKV